MVERIRQGDVPGVQLRLRTQVPATPEELWSWLTDPRRMAVWLASEVRGVADISAGLVLESTAESGRRRRERLTTVLSDPPHRWVTDLQDLDGVWPVPTRLTFEISASANEAEISVFQQGFAHLPISECLTIWEAYRRRWRQALARLKEAIQG